MYEILKLPFEVQCIILGFLSIEDLKTISLVDKSIFKFVTDVSSRRFQLKVDYNNFAMLKRRRKLLRDYASLKLVATSRIFNHLVPPKFCNLLTNLQHLELNFEDDLWSHKKCSVNLFKFLHQLPSIKSLKWDSIEEIPEVTGSFIKENCCSFNLDQLVLSNMDSQKILDIFPESSKLKKLAINCDCHFEQVQYEAVLIEFLSRQSLLNNLELSWIELNDGFFKELPLNLVSLKLDHCSFREHDQFCKFLKEQRFMESLALKQCKGLNNEILQTICELVTLKHLKIDLCNGFEVVNSNDCQFWKLGNLISLNVSNHPTAIGDLFANLFSGAENLSMRNLQFQYVDCKVNIDFT